MNKLFLVLLTIGLLLSGCSEPGKPTISLHLAIEREDINQIERHIFWGSDLNKLNINGQTPLHVAAAQGSHIVVKMLAKNGADIDIPDKQGISIIGQAALNGRTQIVEYLAQQGATYDPDELLNLVVEAGVRDHDIIPLLIKLGADINHQNEAGQAPLHKAIANDERVVAKYLIKEGADVNLADKAGQRPLALAEAQGDEDIIRMLKRNGAQ